MKDGIYIGIDTQHKTPLLLNAYSQIKANNWLKLHGKPMRRKPIRKRANIIVIAHAGHGHGIGL